MSCCGFGGTPVSAPTSQTLGGVIVLDDGTIVSPNPFTTLDFQGDGATVIDGGGGVAIITIPGAPTTISLINGTGNQIDPGVPVAVSGTSFVLADASASATASAVGLIIVGAPAGQIAVAQVLGVLALSTAEWDLVTGQLGGLTVGAVYYLSTVSGLLTTTPPATVGEYVVEIGRAITPQTLLIAIESPILL